VLRPQHLPTLPPPMRHHPALWTRDDFLAAVQRAREYISAGDIFQVVLSQLFLIPRPRTGPLDALEMYRMLRATNPAPYMYCFELPSAGLIGASPEVLVRCDLQPSRRPARDAAADRRDPPARPDDVEDDALATSCWPTRRSAPST
jgi:anthranilate synthase component 1